MSTYRFYKIKENGHINGMPIECELPNDRAAFDKANSLMDGHDVEVWDSRRAVAYLVPDERPKSPAHLQRSR